MPEGKLNVGAAVGRGLLTVSRAHPEWKAPFTGMVNITTGEIAEDIAVYLQESEQVRGFRVPGAFTVRDQIARGVGAGAARGAYYRFVHPRDARRR